MKINSISASAPDFPKRLRNIPQPPRSLYYSGIIPDYKLGVSIVGTRKPTAYGRYVTTELALRLAERGAVIVSGLAHGIDSVAHEAALKAKGTTIAVLPSSLETIYPAAHRGLAERIASQGGALFSEYEPGTTPYPSNFLERNRLVSGLGDVVIVTEAALRSGTMNTVGHALEQGKDVYALPGPITSAMSAGCNALIAQGASPIVNVDDFVEHLIPLSTNPQLPLLAYSADEQAVVDILARGVIDGEELQKESGLDAALFTKTLTMLEIRGAIRAFGANRWGL
jgi:DNA processing protein